MDNNNIKLNKLYNLYGSTQYFIDLFPNYIPTNQIPVEKKKRVLKLYNSSNRYKEISEISLIPDYYNENIDLSQKKFNKSKKAKGAFATVYLSYLNSNSKIKSNIVVKQIKDKEGNEYQASIFHYLLYFLYQRNNPGSIAYLCELKEFGKIAVDPNDEIGIPNFIYGIMDNCGKELYEIKRKSNLLSKIYVSSTTQLLMSIFTIRKNPSNDSLNYRYQFVIDIFMKCLNSLKLIHDVGYLHCDIKLENYLIDFKEDNPLNSIIKIIDFGCVRKNKCEESKLLGTSLYISNDFTNNCINYQKTTLEYHHDFFSLGCMFIEILSSLLKSPNKKTLNLKMWCPFITNHNGGLKNSNIQKYRAGYNVKTHNENMAFLLSFLNIYYPNLNNENNALIKIISKMVHPTPSERYIQVVDNIRPIQNILDDFNSPVLLKIFQSYNDKYTSIQFY